MDIVKDRPEGALAAVSAEVVILLGQDQRILFTSGDFTSVCRIPAEKIVGQSVDALFDREEIKTQARADIQEVLETAKQKNASYMLDSGESAQFLQAQFTPVSATEGGPVTLVVLTCRPMDAGLASHERLRLLVTAVEQVANGVVISDAQTVFLYVNPAFEQITGYSREEAIGRNGKLLQSGLQDRATYAEMKQTLQAGKVWRGEFINRRKNGELYYELNAVSPLLDDNGKIAYFVSVKEDITAMRRAQQAEEAQRRMAETLIDIASVLNRSLHIDDTLDLILANASKVLPMDAIDILLVENGKVKSVRQLGFIERDLLDWLQQNEFVVESYPYMQRIFTTRKPVLVSDTHADPDWVAHPETKWIRSFLGAPICHTDHVIGFIAVYHTLPSAYNDQDARNLKVFADLSSIALVNARLYENSQRQVRRLASLRHIDRAIGSSLDLNLTLRIVIDQAVQILKVDAAALYLLNPFLQELECRASHGLLTTQSLQQNIHLSEFPGGNVIMNRQTAHLNRADFDLKSRPRWIAYMDFHSVHITPLVVKGQIKGVLEVMMRREFKPDADWVNFLETLAGQAAIAIENAELYGQLQQANSDLALSFHSTLDYLSSSLERRSGDVEGHTRRVADLTLQMARTMGMHGNDLQNLYRGALLHDIGALAIPESILKKNGPLSEEEWEVVRQHPIEANRFFSSIAYLRPAVDIPYCHHERWDGSGYPRGLKGLEIPLAARIFAVADVWDILCSDRPYRPAWEQSAARQHLQENAGILFDPDVVDRLIPLINERSPD